MKAYSLYTICMPYSLRSNRDRQTYLCSMHAQLGMWKQKALRRLGISTYVNTKFAPNS